MSEDSPSPLPPYVHSPTFAAIAEALGTDRKQTVDFIETVRRIAGRGKLKQILTCITTDNARTAEDVAAKVRTLPRRRSRHGPNYRAPLSPFYVKNPDTGKFEPRSLPDSDDLYW